MHTTTFRLCFLLFALLAGACVDPGAERVLSISATGTVVGLAYVDRNGNGVLDQTIDGALQGLAVQIHPVGARSGQSRAITNAFGEFTLSALPVGNYAIVIEQSSVPDSLQIVRVDSATFRVEAGDTAVVFVNLSFPTVPVRNARTLPPGKRVFIDGVTLNSWATYGDSTLHVADSTGVIRTTRIAPSAVTSGIRLRLLGTTDIRDGQPSLTDVFAFVLGSAPVPAPVRLTTAVAATADAGRLDAALVQIVGGTILGAQINPAGDLLLTVSDGSGALSVIIDRSSGINPTGLVPGGLLNAIGLLVPGDNRPGVWELKPRTNSDLIATFPTATVAEARKMTLGRIVSIEGVALNSWVTFADANVHLADSTGMIRAVGSTSAPVNLFAGDRVRMLGTIGFRDGQPTLEFTTASVLGPGVLPLATRVTTAAADSAGGGVLDAALVRVIDAVISDTSTVVGTGDFLLRVNDGSGFLEVLIDREAPIQRAPFVRGATFDITGLLVPLANGRDWRLKPRQQSDLFFVR